MNFYYTGNLYNGGLNDFDGIVHLICMAENKEEARQKFVDFCKKKHPYDVYNINLYDIYLLKDGEVEDFSYTESDTYSCEDVF